MRVNQELDIAVLEIINEKQNTIRNQMTDLEQSSSVNKRSIMSEHQLELDNLKFLKDTITQQERKTTCCTIS